MKKYIEETDSAEPCEGSKCKICKQIVPGNTKKDYTCESQYVIYLITSEGKNYVGKTTATMKHRMSQHKHAIKVGHGDGKKFIKYFQQHNFEDAKITVLDSATTKEELHQKERQWIAHYKSDEIGLNSTK